MSSSSGAAPAAAKPPPPPNVISGTAISKQIRAELAEQCASMRSSVVPGLAVILVGERPDSMAYVRMKKKACAEVGIDSLGFDYPETVTQEELIKKIEELNADPAVHGILVQLPLPSHIVENTVTSAVHPDKDVDGLHPANCAKLVTAQTHGGSAKMDWKDMKSIPFHIACTPQGCIELLDRSGVPIEGARAVVIGRSNLVGMPVSLLLNHRNATVTIVHSRTRDVPAVVREADIVVAAVGRARMVKADWLKDGAVVIDVGINSVDDPSAKRGYRLVGDVDYDACEAKCDKITPVPGGVGPMTIAMLLRNTVNGARRAAGI